MASAFFLFCVWLIVYLVLLGLALLIVRELPFEPPIPRYIRIVAIVAFVFAVFVLILYGPPAPLWFMR